ncbi:hypothetical protein [Thermococcus piezophilus]|uniref:hypothetical protein n=1 Tax=Thermococcus piezophilus TaxID=1712654 RepID=UPI000AB696AB|nr:hypothetical protein [Thermococcus piezophilus]
MNDLNFLAGQANWIKGSALAGVMKKAAELRAQERELISLLAGDPDLNLLPRSVLGELAKEVLENVPVSVMYTPANGFWSSEKSFRSSLRSTRATKYPPERSS